MYHSRSRRFVIIAVITAWVVAGTLWPDAARAQETDRAAAQLSSQIKAVKLIHREKPDDPPMDPARADTSARSPRATIHRGPYVSIQVNVDGSGQNIVGDAANEPSIAVDPTDPDTMAIGWRQFDTVNSNFRQAGRAFSQDGGLSWTFPGSLTPGVFRSDPVLDFNTGGTFYYYSLKSNFTCDMFISNDGGVSWQGPIPAWGGDKNWMGVDRTSGIGQGNIYCDWTGNQNFTRSTDGGLTYMTPISSQAMWGTITVAHDGKLYVSGYAGTSTFVVQRSSNAQDPGVTPSWDQTRFINLGGDIGFGGGPNPGGLLGQVWVATNHSSGSHQGEVYLLVSVNPPGGDPLDVHFSRSTDQGATWSAPVRINDDPPGTNAWQWFGTMSVAPNGRIDVVWNDTRNTGQDNLSELYYAYSHDGGQTWSTNVPVSQVFDSHVGWPQQDKIGDYYDMISHDDGAHVAYAATFNNEQDVYYVKVFPNPSLNADVFELSATTGGTVNFSLDAGTSNQNRNYLLIGSLTGTEPGITLPGGLATLPLKWDAFTNFVLANLNSSVFASFLGVLDGAGQAAAQLNATPMPHSLVGSNMYYAYCLDKPFDFASNPVMIEIVQ